MSLINRWRKYFWEAPWPAVVFQVAPSYLAALKIGREIKFSEADYLIEKIPAGVVEANLIQPNIKKPEILEDFIDQAVNKLKPRGSSATIIIPEISSRVFIFSLENAFLTPAELTKFIEWRLDHQLSSPLSAIRYSFQTFNSGQEKKVLVVCSGLEVINEYEAIFQEKKLRPGKITIPSLSLFNFLSEIKEKDFLLVDADFDYLSLIVVIEGTIYLYRQKQLLPPDEDRLEVILKEIENTLYFLEDKIKKKIRLIFLRSNMEKTQLLISQLKMKKEIEVSEIGPDNREIGPMLGGY
ncbi:MAG: type IV pilus biogenesis protein PilM [Candidatus Saccharicenans sp.]